MKTFLLLASIAALAFAGCDRDRGTDTGVDTPNPGVSEPSPVTPLPAPPRIQDGSDGINAEPLRDTTPGDVTGEGNTDRGDTAKRVPEDGGRVPDESGLNTEGTTTAPSSVD
jgi:hypothetical protein